MIYNISFYYVQMLKANSLSRWTLYLTQHNQTKAKLWHIQLWPFSLLSLWHDQFYIQDALDAFQSCDYLPRQVQYGQPNTVTTQSCETPSGNIGENFGFCPFQKNNLAFCPTSQTN